MMRSLRGFLGSLLIWALAGQVQAQSIVFFPPQTTHPTCNGSTNGSIVFSVQGDSTDFFFSWSGGNLPTNGHPTSGDGVVRQTGLSSGTYVIFILDLNSGFDTTVQTTLINPPPISINAGSNISNCLGQPINLAATTNAAPGSIITWSYTNANGPQTLIGQSVTIPAVPAPQSISSNTMVFVNLTDPNGCTASSQVQVTVNPVPVGSANPQTQTICSGRVIINLSSVPTGGSFTWTVSQSGATGATAGSGSIINQIVRATGTGNGTITYNIRPVSSAGCVGPLFNSIVTVKPKPVVTALPDSVSICSGASTVISLFSNIANSSFSWNAQSINVSGASSGTGSSISQTLTTNLAGGKTNYKAVAQFNGCDSDTLRIPVTVKPTPTVTVSPADTINVCSGQVGTFNYSSNIPGSIFTWAASLNEVGGVSGNGSVNSQTYTNSSNVVKRVTYSIKALADGCSSLVKESRVRVRPLPIVTATAVADTICSGANAQITLTSNLPNSTFSWTSVAIGVTGNPPSGTGNTINHTLTTTGPGRGSVTYSIRATNENCQGPVVTYTIFVDPFISIPFTVTPNGTSICSGSTVNLTFQASSPGVTFSWTVAPNGVSGASAGSGNSLSQTLTNSGLGGGFVDYIITPKQGVCNGIPQTVRVVVNPLPAKPTFTISGGSSPICPGQTLTLTSNQIFGNQWFRNGAAIAAPEGVAQSLVVGQAGFYKVRFTNSQGCSNLSDSVQIQVVTLPSPPVISGNPNFCPGGNTILQSSLNAGNQWQLNGIDIPAATGTTLTVTVAGSYTLKQLVGTCTLISLPFVVSALPSPPTPTISGSQFLCTGTTSILASSTASGYQWIRNGQPVSGATNQTLSISQSGQYQVEISDGSGCKSISAIFEVQPVGPNPTPTISGNTSFCPGDSTILTTSNNNPAWKNQWFLNGNALIDDTLKTLVVKLSGSYTVSLTSPFGCVSTSLPTVVTLREAPPIPVISGFSLICEGGSTTLTSSASQGNIWFFNGTQITGANNATYTATTAGTYTVSVFNAQGCHTNSIPFVLGQTTAPQSLATLTNPTTCGGSNGKIEVAVTGGSESYSYSWSPVSGGIIQGQSNQLALQAGIYSVLVSDQNSGCSQAINGMVLNDPANFTVSAQVTNVTSCSGSNGRIELAMTGSQGPFGFAWSPVSGTGPVLNNLAAGYYSVQVTDLNSNCKVGLDSIHVGSLAPPKPDILASGQLEFCEGDSVVFSTTAEGPFQWFRLPGGQLDGETGNTLIAKSSGLYFVRTANPAFPSCFSRSDTLSVLVNSLPANPTINSTQTTVCEGISVVLSSNSNLLKQWIRNGQPIPGANGQFLEVTQAGSYCLQVTNANGCSRISSECKDVIIHPLPPLVTLTGDAGFCPGASATVQFSNADTSQFTYRWLRNNQFIGFANDTAITTTLAGWFKVRIVDKVTNCRIFTDSIFVTAFPPPSAPEISGISTICPGSASTLTSTSANSYQWFFNGNPLPGETNPTITTGNPGSYTVEITDANGCTAISASFVLGVLPQPVASTISGLNSFCPGSSQILTASSNVNYEWMFDGNAIPGANQQTLVATQFGSYQVVVVSGGSGCSDTSEVFVTSPAPSNFQAAETITGITCSNGQAQDNGTISLEITNGSGNYDFNWTPTLPNQANQTDLPAGNYAVVITDQSTQCQVSLTNLVVPGTFTADANLTQPTSCGGTGLIALDIEGGSGNFSYQWSGSGTGIVPNQAIQSNLTAGVYQVVVTDETSQCTQTLSGLELLETGEIAFTIFQQNPTSCTANDGKVSAITGQSGFGFRWISLPSGNVLGTDSVISSIGIGNYKLMVSRGTCLDSAEFSLSAPANLDLTSVIDSADCQNANGSITINSSNDLTPFTLMWKKEGDSGFTANSNPLTGLSSGVYVAIFDNDGCKDSIIVALPQKTDCPTQVCTLEVSASAIHPGCQRNSGGATTIVSGSTNPTYQWFLLGETQVIGTNSNLTNVVEGIYRVVVSEGTCSASDTVTLVRNPGYTLTTSSDSASCNDNDGSLSASFNFAPGGGGMPPFIISQSYQWTKIGDPGFSANTPTVPNVSSGSYQLIFEINAPPIVCTDTVIVQVGKPANCNTCNLSISALADSATCANNDGAISLTVTNASPSASFAWTQIGNPGFSANSQNLSGLAAGIYQVVVADGPCVESLQVVVLKPANCGTCNLQVVASSNPVTCAGGTNGTALAFVVSGGVGPFSYQLNGGPVLNLNQFLATFPNQPAGPFQVVVTDVATSCTDTVSQFIGTQTSLLVNVFTTNPSCGFEDGQIRVVVSGGTNPYQVSLNNNPPVQAINGVAIFSGLQPGNFTISVSDGTPCQVSVQNISISGQAPLQVAYGNVKPTTCFESADGAIQISNLAGGLSGYSYLVAGINTSFQPISAGDSIKNLKAGTYSITIRANGGCEKDTSFTIPGVSKVDFSLTNSLPTTCQDSTGSIRLATFAGGHGAPFSYQLFLNQQPFDSGNSLPVDSIFHNLAAGSYSLILADGQGCADTASFETGIITTAPIVHISANKTAICSSDTVHLVAQNVAFIDLPNYSWYLNGHLLQHSGGEFFIDSLKDGDSIQVKINGSSECLEPDSAWSNVIHFQVLPSNLSVAAAINPIKAFVCIGQSATLQAFSTTNVPNLGYRWLVNGVQLPNDTNATLTLFPGLPVNSVRAIVFTRNTSACIVKSRDTSAVQLVTQIPSLIARDTIRQTAPLAGQFICPNTPVSFSVKSNLKTIIPITVQWFRNDTLVASGPDTFYTFSNLSNNARIRAHVGFDTSLSCLTTNAGAGLDSTKTLLIQVLPENDIRCQPCNLNANITASNINCAGSNSGSIQVTGNGGSGHYRYSLLPSGPANQTLGFFFSLAPGTYSILVRDTVTNCTRTFTGINIIVQNSYNAVVASVNPTPCVATPDGRLEFVSITDGSGDLTKYKYRINQLANFGPNALFTGLSAGTYLMEAMDTLTGCLIQVSRTLQAPSALQAFASVASRPLCYGQFNGSIRLDSVKNGLGLVQYSLSGDPGSFANAQVGQPLPQGFGVGQFSLYFRDLQTGCLDTVQVNMTQPDSIKLEAKLVIGSQCFAPTGQIKITHASGGTTPLNLEIKFPGSNIFLPMAIPTDSMLVNLTGGTYVFQAKDGNQCLKQFILEVPINNPLAQNIQLVKPCIGDSNGVIRLSGLGGGTAPYTFILGNDQGEILATQPDTVFEGLKPGVYSIKIVDASTPSCEVTYQRTLEYPESVQFNIVGTTNSTCENFDGKVRFVISGGSPGYRYSFDTLVNQFTEYKLVGKDTLEISGLSNRLPENLYTLRILDAGPNGGCSYAYRFNVPGQAPLRLVYKVKNLKCNGDNSGEVQIDSLNGTGPVRVQVVDAADGSVIKEAIVEGELFFNSSLTLSGLPAGQYNLKVVQFGACNASRTFAINITQPTAIEVFARQYQSSASGFALGSILLDSIRGSFAPYQVSFHSGVSFSYKPDTLFGNLTPGNYNIQVLDNIGCMVNFGVEVEEDQGLFIPSLFTPNGDGFNDAFEIRNLPPGSSLKVSNRWGKEVYSSSDYKNDWEGKNEEEGTYFWTLKMPGLGSRNGWVVLKR